MASIPVEISNAVGTRNGITPMPNLQGDLNIIMELFDRIPVRSGGSAELGGVWASDRDSQIAEITAQIIVFQTRNNRPVIDGVIDRNGGTLRLMNSLALDPTPTPGDGMVARVVPGPDARPEVLVDVSFSVVDFASGHGFTPLNPMTAIASYTRRLVQLDDCSIKWFGVVIPKFMQPGAIPHINFTPTPIQGGYVDWHYSTFSGWGQLWDDYTWVIGGQMVASAVNQILVLPFYRTSQQRHLGDFLFKWKEAVAAVVTAAIDSVDPMFLRDSYEFDRIDSSSFSNGWVAHQHFNGAATGAADMTNFIYDLDGVAGGSQWRPPNGVIYLNRTPPVGVNPVSGRHWYVGGRWQKFAPMYGASFNSHACCRNHLLYHGLTVTELLTE